MRVLFIIVYCFILIPVSYIAIMLKIPEYKTIYATEGAAQTLIENIPNVPLQSDGVHIDKIISYPNTWNNYYCEIFIPISDPSVKSIKNNICNLKQDFQDFTYSYSETPDNFILTVRFQNQNNESGWAWHKWIDSKDGVKSTFLPSIIYWGMAICIFIIVLLIIKRKISLSN